MKDGDSKQYDKRMTQQKKQRKMEKHSVRIVSGESSSKVGVWFRSKGHAFAHVQ